MVRASTRVRVAGVLLVLLVGVLNFHLPHFLFQAPNAGGRAGRMLEWVLAAQIAAAVVAAIGIARNRRWAWVLGVVLAGITVLLWLAQETVGLPGLPRAWTEPSRLLSLLVEGVYTVMAVHQLRQSRAEHPR